MYRFYNPKVSLIIPVYNREELVIDTIKSIKKQKYKNWECIIVDDISTDNTLKVIQSEVKNDKRFTIEKRDNSLPKGANTCRNIGLKIASGDFIQFFDSDDIMHSEKLSSQVSDILHHSCDISLCQGIRFIKKNNTLNRIGEILINESDNYFEDLVIRKSSINIASTLFSKNIIANEYFDTDLIRSQDYDFIARVLINDPKVCINRNFLYFVRDHSMSITGNYKSMTKQYLFSTYLSRRKAITYALKKEKLTLKIIAYIQKIQLFILIHLLFKFELLLSARVIVSIIIIPFLYLIQTFTRLEKCI